MPGVRARRPWEKSQWRGSRASRGACARGAAGQPARLEAEQGGGGGGSRDESTFQGAVVELRKPHMRSRSP